MQFSGSFAKSPPPQHRAAKRRKCHKSTATFYGRRSTLGALREATHYHRVEPCYYTRPTTTARRRRKVRRAYIGLFGTSTTLLHGCLVSWLFATHIPHIECKLCSVCFLFQPGFLFVFIFRVFKRVADCWWIVPYRGGKSLWSTSGCVRRALCKVSLVCE